VPNPGACSLFDFRYEDVDRRLYVVPGDQATGGGLTPQVALQRNRAGSK
jgi:hypothetical protein